MNKINIRTIGKVEENRFAERLTRTIEEEEVDISDNQDFTDAKYQIGSFIEDVETKRIHHRWII
jgi:sugar/nucleoside kinase (ribokinase family)